MDFSVSKEIVSQKLIGDIVYQSRAVDVKEFLDKGKTEIIKLKHDVWDILVVNRYRIICCSLKSKCLALYDENLNFVKTVDKINEFRVAPAGIASYEDHFYISDQLNHKILKLDFELNKIKSIGNLGSRFNQFNVPFGICCKDGILYICDNRNHRIQIYNEDLQFIDTI